MWNRKTGLLVAAFAAIYLLWGSTYLAIKLAIATVPPLTMMAVRSFSGGAILYAVARWRGAAPPRPSHWAAGTVVGAFLFVVGHGSLAWAEQRVPSGVAALFVATIPLWMTLTEAVTGGRTAVSTRGLVGIPVGMTGILVLVGPTGVLGGGAADLLGAAALVLASLAWSVGSGLTRRLPRPESLTLTTGTYLLTGGAILGMAGVAVGEASHLDLWAVSGRSLGALAYLTAAGTVVAFSAYSWLLRHVPLPTISTYAFVNPVIAVGLGWAVGGEPLTSRVMTAAALVTGGVVLLLSGSGAGRRERSEHEGPGRASPPDPTPSLINERRIRAPRAAAAVRVDRTSTQGARP